MLSAFQLVDLLLEVVQVKCTFERSYGAAYVKLDPYMRKQISKRAKAWMQDPWNTAFDLKAVTRSPGYWRVDAGHGFRAVGKRTASSEFCWIWVGPHQEYVRYVKKLKVVKSFY